MLKSCEIWESAPDSSFSYRFMGECELEAAGHSQGLLQSHFTRSEDFEDANRKSFQPKDFQVDDAYDVYRGSLSQRDWAKLLLEGTGGTGHKYLVKEDKLDPSALLYLQNSTNSTNSTKSAASVEGVSMNKHGDLVIFLSSLGTNCGTVLIAFLMLALLKWLLPTVFKRARPAATVDRHMEQRELAAENQGRRMKI